MTSILNDNQIRHIRELYETTFAKYEQEPFDCILERVKNNTSFIIANNELNGGAIFDWYPKSKTLLLIYLFVDKKHRGNGIGRKLYEYGIELKKQLGAETILFEVEKEGSDDFSIERIGFYNHIGSERIDIDYVQPPLDKNLPYLHLYLYKYKDMSNGDLKTFLTEFYEQLGYPNDNELIKMINTLDNYENIC